jgi:hypothetical protein
VVTGAEGQRRVDLDSDVVGAEQRAMMRAMHQETAGLNRAQSIQTPAHPIRGRKRLEGQRARKRLRDARLAGIPRHRHGDKRADCRLVGRIAKVERERPSCGTRVFALAFDLGNGDGDSLAVAALGQR